MARPNPIPPASNREEEISTVSCDARQWGELGAPRQSCRTWPASPAPSPGARLGVTRSDWGLSPLTVSLVPHCPHQESRSHGAKYNVNVRRCFLPPPECILQLYCNVLTKKNSEYRSCSPKDTYMVKYSEFQMLASKRTQQRQVVQNRYRTRGALRTPLYGESPASLPLHPPVTASSTRPCSTRHRQPRRGAGLAPGLPGFSLPALRRCGTLEESPLRSDGRFSSDTDSYWQKSFNPCRV